jgi:DMSO/TMAO reductase YedYZ molybdopterin-dependent catalytic subunit
MNLLEGAVAALLAGLTMVLLRSTLQVRSIPERTMEWLLLFVPLDAFEAGIRRFGFGAKVYALYGASLAMLVLLAALGAVIVHRRWSLTKLLGLAGGLWLFTMVVIMPLTGAGFFGRALVEGTAAAAIGHLAVALIYAAALVSFSAFVPGWRKALTGGTTGTTGRQAAADGRDALDGSAGASLRSRRSAAVVASSALASLAATFAVARWLPNTRLTRVLVLDPQQPFPSGGIEPPNPHPNLVATPGTPRLAPTATPAAPAGASTSSAAGEPPVRQFARDKDGAALPSGRRPGELASLLSSNEDFYIVTKNAAGDPLLTTRDWRLRIDGEVQRSVEIDYTSLRRLPSVEVVKTLECISNFVSKCELAPFGCDLISTARWRGVRVADVLALAGGVKPGAVSLATFGADEYTTSLPIDVAMDPDTLLVYEMNGQMLPREHGFPVRMLVPGRYGMKNAKWVVALRVTNREFLDWYGQRNWSKTGTVKTMARIDMPGPNAVLPAGDQRIAGIAYAGDRGIQKVEFSADGGQTWTEASFVEAPAGRDVWVRWQGQFSLEPGADLTLMARATDGTGALQPEAFGLPQPEGGSGWFSTSVRARA